MECKTCFYVNWMCLEISMNKCLNLSILQWGSKYWIFLGPVFRYHLNTKLFSLNHFSNGFLVNFIHSFIQIRQNSTWILDYLVWLSDAIWSMHVTVKRDKPLARLKVVIRLSVDKGQVLQSGISIEYQTGIQIPTILL